MAAEANGEDEDANASNPVRLRLISLRVGVLGVLDIVLLKSADGATIELLPGFGLEEALGKGDVLVLAHGELLVANRLGPFTVANGELVEAYAANPP